MILVVSYRGDEHTDLVRQRLLGSRREVVQIDLGDFPRRAGLSLTWAMGHPPRYEVAGPDGAADLAAAGVVWWRRVRPFEVDPAIPQEQRRAFAGSETAQAVHGAARGIGEISLSARRSLRGAGYADRVGQRFALQ